MRKIEELEDEIRTINDGMSKTNEKLEFYSSFRSQRKQSNLDNSQSNIPNDENSTDMKHRKESSELSPFKSQYIMNQNTTPNKGNLDSSINAGENENKSFMFQENDPRGVKLKAMFTNIQRQVDDLKSKVEYLNMSATSAKSPGK